jgi:tetratricopeptide (TPR) repeat protein
LSLRQERLQKEISKAQTLQKKGYLKEAINLYQKLLLKDHLNTLVINEIAKIYLQSNHINEGVFYLKKSLEIKPDQPVAHFDLGTAYSQLKNLEESLACYIKSIGYDDSNPKSYFNKGIIESKLKYLNDALVSFKKSLDLDPTNFDAITAIAVVLTDLNFIDEAIKYLDKAMQLNPNIAEIYFNKANLLKQKNKNDEALKNYDEAIRINSSLAKSYINKGLLLYEMNLMNEALKNYDIAIQLNPNCAEIYNNKAILLNEIGEVNEAIGNLNKAIALDPNYAEAYNNKGLVLYESHIFDEALQYFNKAIDLNPQFLGPYQNKAIYYLNKCDFEKGWYFWEYREHLKLDFRQDFKKNFSDLGRVYIFSEQGLGDVILFSSVLKELQSNKNLITLEVDKRLIDIYQRSFENIKIVSKEQEESKENFEHIMGIASLPGYFRKKTTCFSKQISPFLKADSEKVNFFRNKILSNKLEKKVCGISWKTLNKKNGRNRSINITEFKEILNLTSIHFVSLQFSLNSNEVSSLSDQFNIDLKNFSNLDLYNDLDSYISVIDACDFVITIDNSTAHFAGALGKKTFLLVPFGRGRHFYWNENFSNSLWYPTVEIYTQSKDGSWSSPINEILKNLNNYTES